MLVADFDFDLPSDRIAQRALPRGESRLLCLDREGVPRHESIAELPEILRPGDLLVVNDTRVVPARLFARRQPGGGRVELLLVEKLADRRWDALARPGRKTRPGTRLELAPGLVATVVAKRQDGRHIIELSAEIEPRLEELGHVPLPPYIDRADDESDRDRYQTLFAREPGAIAAPTAGLHFSQELLDRLAEREISRATVTLHVGIGTFKPVVAQLAHEHKMESERFVVPASTVTAITAARRAGGRIVAVGTTVVRALESAADAAGGVRPGAGATDLFILPGYRFRVVDLLLTNFHLPRSTLLMLVSAFAGRERVLAAYHEAIERGYRFYSYGDAMLCARDDGRAG